MNKRKILIVCIVILFGAGGVTAMIFLTEPTAQREGATKETAMLVDVIEATRQDYNPSIVATGTVQPEEDVTLSPLVGGQIVSRSDKFTPGGFVRKGEVLLQIDPSDYRNTLELRKSDLLQRQSDLNVEMGRQQVARQDYRLVGDSLSPEEKALVLRQPQLEAVKATVEAAKASVAQAELNLKRTTIRAPFDAHILSRNVTIGSQVAPGNNLGRIVGTERYWVVVSVPVSKLPWLSFPESEDDQGSGVRIYNKSGYEGFYREGYLYRQIGALDAQTRLASVIVVVPDPLEDIRPDKPGMIIGSFVEVEIEAETLEDVVRISRDHIRNNETVWVMNEGKLAIRSVDIVFSDAEYSYVIDGVNDGDQIVTTNLSTVVEGVGLRTESTQ